MYAAVLQDLRHLDEAVTVYSKLLRMRTNDVNTKHNYAGLLGMLRELIIFKSFSGLSVSPSSHSKFIFAL